MGRCTVETTEIYADYLPDDRVGRWLTNPCLRPIYQFVYQSDRNREQLNDKNPCKAAKSLSEKRDRPSLTLSDRPSRQVVPRLGIAKTMAALVPGTETAYVPPAAATLVWIKAPVHCPAAPSA
jgi:hypothetical protein